VTRDLGSFSYLLPVDAGYTPSSARAKLEGALRCSVWRVTARPDPRLPYRRYEM
jgi:hypothetical protein